MAPQNRPTTASSKDTAPLPQETADVIARLDSLQDELQAVYGELERLNRLATMGTIAGMLAHEFNNILTPVLSYAQMSLAAPDDLELTRKALQRAVAGSERAAKIADAILDFVREEPSPAASAATSIVANVVGEAISCLARDPARDGIRLRIDVPETMQVAIKPIALQQVLVNAIVNAKNAMGPRGGSIGIQAQRLREPPVSPEGAADSRGCSTWNTPPCDREAKQAGWAVLRVRDSGPGMTSEQLAALFTPFRTRAADAASPRGTGLGMVIMKRLVEAAAGWVVVESRVGDGTVITIVLPIA